MVGLSAEGNAEKGSEDDDDEEEQQEDVADATSAANEVAQTQATEPNGVPSADETEPNASAATDPAAHGPFKRLEPHDLYSCHQLVDLFHFLCSGSSADRHPVIGMVGYPNV